MASPASGAPAAPGHLLGATDSAFTVRNTGSYLVLSVVRGPAFEALRAALRAGLGAVDGVERFRGASMRLDVTQRDVDLYELRRLIHFLKDELGIHIVGVVCATANLQRFVERELKVKVHLEAPTPVAVPAPEPAPEPPTLPDGPRVDADAPTVTTEPPAAAEVVPERAGASEAPTEVASGAEPEGNAAGGGRVLTIGGTVRSGAVVRFAGDVHVFGDVNPGGQVVAGGNIVVFGALKGLAHAGSRGDERAFVLAFDMRPSQLRLAGTFLGERRAGADRDHRQFLPEIASIVGSEIIIEPFRGRLPGHVSKESA